MLNTRGICFRLVIQAPTNYPEVRSNLLNHGILYEYYFRIHSLP